MLSLDEQVDESIQVDNSNTSDYMASLMGSSSKAE